MCVTGVLNDLFVLNLVSIKWTSVKTEPNQTWPLPRMQCGFTANLDNLYLFGGASHDGLLMWNEGLLAGGKGS